jgi:hypothetical protein
VIPIPGEPDLILENRGAKQTGSVPLHVYAAMRRDTDVFERGLVVRVDDEPEENPNVIWDVPAWLDQGTEKSLVDHINRITSEPLLMVIYGVLDEMENPSGKYLRVKKALTDKVSEEFGHDLE